ncbi:MAG: glycosyltransferase family 4 protein [Lachnospiraceae bacterium]|nr:glycosyltransferase family 4 protein [Lachnospiraceae bacterium]
MKIVFVIPDMPGGGTERVVSLLANEYSRRRIEVAILLFAGHETAYQLDDRIEVVSMGAPTEGRLGARIERIRKMRKYYKENRNCQIWSFSVMGAVFSVIAALGQKHYLLVSERSDPNQYEHPKIRDFFYGFADVVVCQTKESMESFPIRIVKKAVVLPNPVDIGTLEPCDGQREKRVVAVGRIGPPKNHELLIRAFARFVEDFPEYTLELYGRGVQEAELRELAGRLGIGQKVIFCGFSERVQEKINDAAMYVLSSDYEGVSNSLLEAIALGIPVIATDCPIGGCRTYVKDGINGLLVPVGEIEPLAAAMKKIAGDSVFAGKLSLEGRKLREEIQVERIADRFLALQERKGKQNG